MTTTNEEPNISASGAEARFAQRRAEVPAVSHLTLARIAAGWLALFLLAPACSSASSSSGSNESDTNAPASGTGGGGVGGGRSGSGGRTQVVDAGHDSGGGDAGERVDAGPFEIGQLSGLALWLDAAKGITFHGDNYVRNWADQSNNHNDCLSGEPHPVEEPTLVASSINSLPAIHFNPGSYTGDGGVGPNCNGENCGAGNNFFIADSPSLRWGTDDFLITVVGRYANSDPKSPEYSYAGTFFFRSAKNGPWFRGNSYPSSPSTGLSALLSSREGGDINELVTEIQRYNDGKARLMTMQRVGSKIFIRVNGKQTDAKTFTEVLDVTGEIDAGDGIVTTIGASYSDVSRLDGDIAEVIAVRGSIAASDLSGLERYLMSKYAL